MTTPYFTLLDLQQRLTKLWARVGRPTAAEFSQARASIPAEATELGSAIDRLEEIVTFGADERPMSPARRRELLGASATGRAVLAEEDVATFSGTPARRTPVHMSAERRRELLSTTALGRDVLKDEDEAAAASFSETPAPTDAKARRRAEQLALTPLGREVLKEEAARKRNTKL